MLTARAAAALLASADSVERLAPLTNSLGFAPPSPVDGPTRAALGVPDACCHALIARGPGALRALLLDLPTAAGGAPRDAVARAASRLATRSPHLLWLLAAVEQRGSHTVLATWSPERTPPRVAALVVDRRNVVDSDAETLRSLAAAAAPPDGSPLDDAHDVLTHARWLDLLGRDSLTRAFYRALERIVATLADSAPSHYPLADRREIALLYTSRLLFLSFLEAKGWLDADHAFLAHTFDQATAHGRHYHRHTLLPLFFGTLNTAPAARAPSARAFGRIPYLNGGLFARTPLERRARDLLFPDDALGLLFSDLLGRYRFTAREDSATWSEAAIDPEMLGKAFESLMSAAERRSSGAFYTPQALVEEVTATALRDAFADAGAGRQTMEALLSGSRPIELRTRATVAAAASRLRVLDPACGSGAFLVHALERLAALIATCGDARPTPEIRRDVLTRSIFGVDVNPTAVWLCELRLWLSVVIESDETDPRRVPTLPNLDRHVRVGDSLAGGTFDARAHSAAGRHLGALRERYARATGRRKHTLARALEREERLRALAALDTAVATTTAQRRDLVRALRTRDLFGARRAPPAADRSRLTTLRESARQLRARRRRLAAGAALPFAFATHFADAAHAGGFDVVVGNPPWVRLHHIPHATRETLRREFRTFRDAPWRRGARLARAGLGFSAQVDLAALFVERSLALLRPGGVLALLVPAKLWRSLAGGGVRELLHTDAALLTVEDWSESPHAFDASVYPALVAARRPVRAAAPLALGAASPPAPHDSDVEPCVDAAVRRGRELRRWRGPGGALRFDDSPGSPWLLLPPDVRRAFDHLASAGRPLAESGLGRPRLGVKCGCNDAFVVSLLGPADTPARSRVAAAGRIGEVERAILRPLLRGETIGRWRSPASDEHLLWTLHADGRPLPTLPPGAAAWLAPWRGRLAARVDARARPIAHAPWWTLFRTDAASADRPRVAWGDLARAPRAAVLPSGDPTVPLNSCYVLALPTIQDAHAFAAILNSAIGAAWLGALAEPARGGYRRFMGWTVALLPIPRDWPRARTILAPLAARACAGERVDDSELDDAVTAAYALRRRAIAPLLDWDAG